MKEIGTISHDGNSYSAGGASVSGRDIAAYVKIDKAGNRSLTTWTGQTLLDCRSFVAGEYWTESNDDTQALVFRLTQGRAIVGYSLGDGMLFRGELIEIPERYGTTWDHSESADWLSNQANQVAERWIEIDHEDYLQDQEEQRQEYLAEQLVEWENIDSL